MLVDRASESNWIACLAQESLGQAFRRGLDTRAIVLRGDRALSHGSDQFRLVPQRLPSPGVRRLAGDGLQGLELSREHRDVAFGVLPELVEGFGQQALKARARAMTRSSPWSRRWGAPISRTTSRERIAPR